MTKSESMLQRVNKDDLITMIQIYKQKLRQAEINKKSAKTRYMREVGLASRGRQRGYHYADVMCDIIINNEPDWDSIVNGYDSMNYEYCDIKEIIEYIYGNNVPVELPDPCIKHGYDHPDNCGECDEEKEKKENE
jgi:hypothetical protein